MMSNAAFIREALAIGLKWRIKPKRDFGSGRGYYVRGEYVKQGFVVTLNGCNVMPAATWFETIPEAMEHLRIWIEVQFDAGRFWRRVMEKREPS